MIKRLRSMIATMRQSLNDNDVARGELGYQDDPNQTSYPETEYQDDDIPNWPHKIG